MMFPVGKYVFLVDDDNDFCILQPDLIDVET